MADLVHQLAAWRGRRVCLLGVGDAARGDDGFGVRLAAALAPRLAGGAARAVDAGTCPERYVGRAAADGFETIVFADAAAFGAAPGTLVLAAAKELAVRPPAAATHRVPISVLAAYAEGLGLEAFLLGVEPARLEGEALTRAVEGTLCAVVELLADALGPRHDRAPLDGRRASGNEVAP